MVKTIRLVTDMGYVQPGEIATLFYDEVYILNAAGYSATLPNPDEMSDEYIEKVENDFINTAIMLEENLKKTLIHRETKMFNDIDFETVNTYEVAEKSNS